MSGSAESARGQSIGRTVHVAWDSNTCLPTSRQEVDHLLDRAGAVHVQRDVDEFLCDGLADDVPLLVRRVLKQLLAEVVPEGI